jgi:hypothetical protein
MKHGAKTFGKVMREDTKKPKTSRRYFFLKIQSDAKVQFRPAYS